MKTKKKDFLELNEEVTKRSPGKIFEQCKERKGTVYPGKHKDPLWAIFILLFSMTECS